MMSITEDNNYEKKGANLIHYILKYVTVFSQKVQAKTNIANGVPDAGVCGDFAAAAVR
jgi:hypothetical protein